MYKHITLRNTQTINGSTFNINFDSHKNIIIGPKGGGKSTLFNLIIGFYKGYQAKHITDALERYGLEAVEIEKESGEKIKYSSLTKIKKSEFENKANAWNEVIWQSDEVKSKLDDSKYIEKHKKEFIEELFLDNKSVQDFIPKLKDIYNLMDQLKQHQETGINWNIILELDDNDAKHNNIINLDYDNFTEVRSFKEQAAENENIIREIKKYNQIIKTITMTNILEDKQFKTEEELKHYIDDLIDKNAYLSNLLAKKIDRVTISKNMLSTFTYALGKTKEYIKKEQKDTAILSDFQTRSISYFKHQAIIIKELKNKFDELQHGEITMSFKETKKIGFMDLKIDKEIPIDIDLRTNLLKTILYAPSSINDIEDWMLKQFKQNGSKDFDTKKIYQRIKKEVGQHIHVMAGDKKYSSMSSGEKSIFGIQFKLDRMPSTQDTLFLDQPEDNLDNKTIVHGLVDRLKGFKGQSFIVTHNANVGILTGTNKVIVADIQKEKNKYKEGIIAVNADNADSDASSFLEGGVNSLNNRYTIINNTKGETNAN